MEGVFEEIAVQYPAFQPIFKTFRMAESMPLSNNQQRSSFEAATFKIIESGWRHDGNVRPPMNKHWQILALETDGILFTFICCKIGSYEKAENKRKRGRGNGPFSLYKKTWSSGFERRLMFQRS